MIVSGKLQGRLSGGARRDAMTIAIVVVVYWSVRVAVLPAGCADGRQIGQVGAGLARRCFPPAAFALGLGDVRLLSSLNAPLDAEIELVRRHS